MEMIALDKELKENSYPGRGIIIGRSADGTASCRSDKNFQLLQTHPVSSKSFASPLPRKPLFHAESYTGAAQRRLSPSDCPDTKQPHVPPVHTSSLKRAADLFFPQACLPHVEIPPSIPQDLFFATVSIADSQLSIINIFLFRFFPLIMTTN